MTGEIPDPIRERRALFFALQPRKLQSFGRGRQNAVERQGLLDEVEGPGVRLDAVGITGALMNEVHAVDRGGAWSRSVLLGCVRRRCSIRSTTRGELRETAPRSVGYGEGASRPSEW